MTSCHNYSFTFKKSENYVIKLLGSVIYGDSYVHTDTKK